MRWNATTALCGFGLILVLAAPSAAETRVVTGGDAGALQAALDASVAGDVVVVKKGTYTGNFTMNDTTGVTLRGAGKPTLTSNGAGTVLTIGGSTDIAVSGIKIRNAGEDGVRVTDSTNVMLRSLDISMCTQRGILIRSGSDRVTVDRSKLSLTGMQSIHLFDSDGGGPTNCVVRKTKISDSESHGIELDGDGHLVEGVTIKDTSGDSIHVPATATNATIQKSKLLDPGDDAIELGGADHTVFKVSAKNVFEDGVDVNGSGCLIEKFTVKTAGDEGIELDGPDNRAIKCKITGAGENGIKVDGDGCTVDGCKVKKSTDDGIHVDSENNTVKNCKVSKSTSDDYLDTSGGVTNTYENNKPDDVVFD